LTFLQKAKVCIGQHVGIFKWKNYLKLVPVYY
jgi:hypothetical protein